MSNRIKFFVGDEVSQVDNLEKKLRVSAVVFKEKKLSHIVCRWWNTKGELQKINAHSHELIPWGIAKQGQEQVDSYLESIEKMQTVERFKNEHS